MSQVQILSFRPSKDVCRTAIKRLFPFWSYSSLRCMPSAYRILFAICRSDTTNNAIYRKRYAFTDALIKLLVFFGRVVKNSYQLFFPRLPATSTKKRTDSPSGCLFFFLLVGAVLPRIRLCAMRRSEFAYPAQRSTSSLVRRRAWIYSPKAKIPPKYSPFLIFAGLKLAPRFSDGSIL